jgi:hypothetical protein
MTEPDTSREAGEKITEAMYQTVGLVLRNDLGFNMAAAGWLCPEDARALLARAEAAERAAARWKRGAEEHGGRYWEARYRDEAEAAKTAHAAGFRAGAEAMREAAAQDADCGCPERDAVLAAKPKSAARWQACGREPCGALTAADIRALPLPEPQEPPHDRL